MTYLWKYTPREVADLVRLPKRSREGAVLEFKKKRETTREIYTSLAGTKQTLPPMDYSVGGNPQETDSFHAALLLEKKRVRGIDFSPIEKKKFYKTHIPEGWHENVIDWKKPTNDEEHNKHVPLPGFENEFVDLQGFHYACARRWNIELETEDTLL